MGKHSSIGESVRNGRRGLTSDCGDGVVIDMDDDQTKATKDAAMQHALSCVNDPQILIALLDDARRLLTQRGIERIIQDKVYWEQFRTTVKNTADEHKATLLAALNQLEEVRNNLIK